MPFPRIYSHMCLQAPTTRHLKVPPYFLLLFITAIICLCQGCQTVTTGIVQEKHMTRVTKEANTGTLVVFDIDNTLIEPLSQLGSDQWFYHLIEVGIRRGMTRQRATEWADGVFNDTQNAIKIHCVDQDTPDVLARLRHDGIKYFALTARSSGIHETTHRQLESVGLAMTAGGFNPGAAAKPGMIGKRSLYDRGIFYIGESGPTKGEALLRILHSSGYRPDRIVFIDDKEKHVHTVNESLTQEGIPHLCLRFSKSDAKVAALNHELESDPLLSDERVK